MSLAHGNENLETLFTRNLHNDKVFKLCGCACLHKHAPGPESAHAVRLI